MQGVANGNSPQDQELRGLLYQHAALLPETGDGRFNQRELIERFSRGEKPDPVLSLLQTDYTQMFKGLAGRNEKVLADAALEQERSGSYHAAFDPDLYLLNAFSVQSRLVRQADQALRQDPDFAALRESLKNTWQLAKSPNTLAILKLGAEMLENPEAYNLLQTGKQDQLITSNSTEYTRMQQSLAKVQRVQRVLLEGKGQVLERHSKTDFIKDLQKAKQEAFRYLRLKRDNGKKNEFHYESGKRRAEEAERFYGKLCRLQDALDLRSPAEKLYDEARMELMKHRASHRWLNEDGRKHIAKMIYYKSLMDSGVPVEEQNLRLSPPHMDQKLELLNRYVKSITYYLADVIVLCDEAMEEKGSFRDRVSIYADHWKQRYQERNQPRFLQQAQEDLRMGYALDLAAKELGFSFKSNPQNFTPKNPRLHSKALEVKQRPEFREIVDRIIQGKSIQQLEGLHKPANLDRSEEAQEAYARAENTVNLEKRCAKITAESMLLAKEGKEPSPEKLENAARVLRQDPRFQAYIREKTAPMTTLDIDKLYHNLSMEEVRNQVRDQVLARLAGPQPIQNDRPIIQNPQVQNPVINPGNAALSQQGS